MDARLVFPFLLLLAAAAAPLASTQLAPDFYKTSCPDVEKIIFGVVEKRFKEDPGTAAGLLRLIFHDCFANGCDASILIDPLSNQAAEKEAGPNISVKGYDIIDEIKTEVEKKCPDVVSCADILAVGARDAVKLTGGPNYEVTTGRRDSLTSNREDADNLPGPDIAVPKLIDDFDKKGFSVEEMIALVAGGHTIGTCKCFFIEVDAAPIDPDYKKNVSAACDGANRDKGSVPMDQITPNVFDGNYFGLVLAKKMPLTVDRLMGMDPKTEPVVKAMSEKPEDFIPKFAKAMEKISVLGVITGKDGEIRKSCGEFNNPQATSDGPSVIRISSLQPDQMQGLAQQGAKGVAEARKVGGQADIRKVNGGEELRKEAGGVAATKVPGPEEIKPIAGNEAANKVPGGDEIKKIAGNEAPNTVTSNVDTSKVASNTESTKVIGGQEASKGPAVGEETKKAVGTQATSQVISNTEINKAVGTEEIKKDVGTQQAGQVTGNAEINKAVGTEAISSKAAGGIEANGNKVLGDEPASKLPGRVAGLGEEKIKQMPSHAANAAGDEETRKRNEEIMKRNLPKLRARQEAAKVAPGGEEAAKAAADEETKKRSSLRGGQQ